MKYTDNDMCTILLCSHLALGENDGVKPFSLGEWGTFLQKLKVLGVKPDVVLNLALPYQDLTIMDACLECKVSYVDTANYEPEDTAKFEYKWQWAYREKFEKAGITALLGSGFDPGVTGVFSAYALKHHFDEINYIDILDCNAGDHGYPFATNFNPEINIREVSAKGSYWEDGKWVETEPMEIKRVYNFPEVGPKVSAPS